MKFLLFDIIIIKSCKIQTTIIYSIQKLLILKNMKHLKTKFIFKENNNNNNVSRNNIKTNIIKEKYKYNMIQST